LDILWWVIQNNCPLPSFRTIIKFKHKYFTASKKLLLYCNSGCILQFKTESLVKTWIRSIDDICSELCYSDLSLLIKSFI
jgi:hypothetical protein